MAFRLSVNLGSKIFQANTDPFSALVASWNSSDQIKILISRIAAPIHLDDVDGSEVLIGAHSAFPEGDNAGWIGLRSENDEVGRRLN